MPKTIIHLGTKVEVSFAVLDENGNAFLPQAVLENGAVGKLPAAVFNLTALDAASFEQLCAKIQGVRDHYTTIFCQEEPNSAPPPVPDLPVVPTPEPTPPEVAPIPVPETAPTEAEPDPAPEASPPTEEPTPLADSPSDLVPIETPV